MVGFSVVPKKEKWGQLDVPKFARARASPNEASPAATVASTTPLFQLDSGPTVSVVLWRESKHSGLPL